MGILLPFFRNFRLVGMVRTEEPANRTITATMTIKAVNIGNQANTHASEEKGDHELTGCYMRETRNRNTVKEAPNARKKRLSYAKEATEHRDENIRHNITTPESSR